MCKSFYAFDDLYQIKHGVYDKLETSKGGEKRLIWTLPISSASFPWWDGKLQVCVAHVPFIMIGTGAEGPLIAFVCIYVQ